MVLAVINVFVALGTLALAGVTAWMAIETRREVKTSVRLADTAERQVKASEAQAAVARESLAAAIQPILAEVPSDETTRLAAIDRQTQAAISSQGHLLNTDPAYIAVDEYHGPEGRVVRIRVPVWNVGHGPALITSACLTSVAGTNRRAEAMATIIAAGQRIEVPFVLRGAALGGFTLGRSDPYPDFTVALEYTNAFGQEPRVTKLDVRQIPDSLGKQRCVIAGVTFRKPGDPAPIARLNLLDALS